MKANYTLILGRKFYEFTNHPPEDGRGLGNVLTVFTDLKIPQDTDNNNVVDNYKIGIVRTADYSPFGVALDGRTKDYEIPIVTNGTPGVIYQHKFDDSPNAHPYTGTPSNLDPNLTQVSWTNSLNAWTNYTGHTGRAIAINSATPDTTKLYLNLTVNPGYLLDISSYSFYHRSSSTGYTNYKLYINNILIGNGSIFVSSGSTLQHTGTVNVLNAIAGLSGSITVRFDLFGGSNGSNGTFRMDDFVLNGYTTALEHWNPAGYRYGYQGSEKDDEVKGEGNSYTTFFRQLDPRVGRWFSIDPKASHWESPYVSMHNNPIMFNDIMGDSIPTSFYNENGIKTNEIPEQVQKMFNNEYGISVGYQNGMLYKTGDVKTDLTVSSSAKADWESFLGTTNTDNSLTFGYNIGFSSNDNKQIPVIGGVSINYIDAYIDLADFNSDFSLKGAQYSKNKNDTGWGSATIPIRTQNLARTTEHEFFGHCVNNLTDDSFFTFGENNNFYCTAGEVEYKISNKYREEMGLLLRINYLDNGHTSTQPSVNFMYVQYGHSYKYSSCPQSGDFPYQEFNSCYGTMRMSSEVRNNLGTIKNFISIK